MTANSTTVAPTTAPTVPSPTATRVGRTAALAGALILALGLTAACSGGGSGPGAPNTVKAESGYKFSPANIELPAGKPATITLDNVDSIAHNWVVEGIPAASISETAAKKKGTVTFTPPAAGTYKIVCNLPGHAEAGMVGQLTVK